MGINHGVHPGALNKCLAGGIYQQSTLGRSWTFTNQGSLKTWALISWCCLTWNQTEVHPDFFGNTIQKVPSDHPLIWLFKHDSTNGPVQWPHASVQRFPGLRPLLHRVFHGVYPTWSERIALQRFYGVLWWSPLLWTMVWQSVVIPPLQLIHWALYLLLVIDHSYIHQANFRVFLGDIPMFRRTHFQSKTMNSQLLHLLLLLHQESSLFQATNLAFLGEHPILWLRFLPGDCGQGHSDHPSPPQGRRRSRLSAPCSCPGCRRKQWWFCLGCFEGISAHIRLYIYIST